MGTRWGCGDTRTLRGRWEDTMGTPWGHHGDKGDNGATAPTCWAAPAAPGRAHGPAAPQTDAAPRSVRGHQRRGDTGDSGTTRLSVRPSIRLSVCPPPCPGFPPPLSPLTSRYRWIPGSVPLSRNTVSHLSPMRTLGWGTAVMGGGGTALGTPRDGRGTQWGHGSAQGDRGGNGDMGGDMGGDTWGDT